MSTTSSIQAALSQAIVGIAKKNIGINSNSDSVFTIPEILNQGACIPTDGAELTALMAQTVFNQIALNSLSLRNTFTGLNALSSDKIADVVGTTAVSMSSQNVAVQKAYGSSAMAGSSIFNNAKMIAKKISTLYEGGEVTGNFDGQGVSIGYLQWNMGSGTLQPLLREMASGAASEFDQIFEGKVTVSEGGKTVKKSMALVLREMLSKSKGEQLEWAKSINSDKDVIVEPWKSAFEELVKNNKFIQVEDKYAQTYLNNASKIMNDAEIGVKTVRGYALAFDIAVQNGSVKSVAKKLVTEALEGKQNKLTNVQDTTLTQNQKAVILDLNDRLKGETDLNLRKLYYTAAAVAISSNDRFAKDVWSRKAAIIEGSGTVHGNNYNFEQTAGLNDQTVV